MKVSVDTSGLKRKIDRLGRATPQAEAAAVRIIGEHLARTMLAISPRDTNRYARGWAMAANAAGVGTFSVPDVQASRYNERLIDRLEIQAERWRQRAASAKRSADFWRSIYQRRYADTGRSGKWERDARQRVQLAETREKRTADLYAMSAKALDELKANPDALVIWGRRSKRALAKGQIATARVLKYGGTGQFFRVGTRSFVTLHNLEPHASIVERNHRVASRAIATARLVGVRRASAAFLKKIRAAQGV